MIVAAHLMRLRQGAIICAPARHSFGDDRVRTVIVACRLDRLMVAAAAEILKKVRQPIPPDDIAQMVIERCVPGHRGGSGAARQSEAARLVVVHVEPQGDQGRQPAIERPFE